MPTNSSWPFPTQPFLLRRLVARTRVFPVHQIKNLCYLEWPFLFVFIYIYLTSSLWMVVPAIMMIFMYGLYWLTSLLKSKILWVLLCFDELKINLVHLNVTKNFGLSNCNCSVISYKQISEVGLHDFVLLLLDLGVRVIWWENEIDLSAQRVYSNDPEVAGVHLLLQTVGVLNKLLM